MLRILHVTYSFRHGGAARACFRLAESLARHDVDSLFLSVETLSESHPFLHKRLLINKLVSSVLSRFFNFFYSETSIKSASIIRMQSLINLINDSNSDIVHLHWFQHEMFSISQLKLIKKPLVWTMHDMWPFLGLNHYKLNPDKSFLTNYIEKCFIKRKLYLYPKFIQFIAPSLWIAKIARGSVALKNQPIKVLPNVIDTSFWNETNSLKVRLQLGIPSDKKVLLISALSLDKDQRKGYSIAINVINQIKNNNNIFFLIIGVSSISQVAKNSLAFPQVTDDIFLRDLYTSADAVLVPSLIESFGQVALEANSCARPVICFNSSGLKSIVKKGVCGYLATCFDEADLIKGINEVLFSGKHFDKYACRSYVYENFSYSVVSLKFKELYSSILSNNFQNEVDYGL